MLSLLTTSEVYYTFCAGLVKLAWTKRPIYVFQIPYINGTMNVNKMSQLRLLNYDYCNTKVLSGLSLEA